MVSTARLEDKLYTYLDIMSVNDDNRWELIDGVPYCMSPPSRIHQKVSMEISRQIANYLLDKKCDIYTAPFGVRLCNQDSDDKEIINYVEPDISVICDKNKLDKKGCKGAPDLIIEILSPSTAKIDLLKKFNLYRKYGVKEYWIVDPDERDVSVYVLGDNGEYSAAKYYGENDKVSINILEDIKIDFRLVFLD